MRKTSWILTIAVLFLLAPHSAQAQTRQCSINAPCCSTAVTCTSEQTCKCSFTCGPDESTCSCVCLAGGDDGRGRDQPLKPHPDGAESHDTHPVTGEPRPALRLDTKGVFSVPEPIPLWAFSRHLESQINWTVLVSPDVRGVRFGPAEWRGELSEILSAVAKDFEVKLSINDNGHVISFTRVDEP